MKKFTVSMLGFLFAANFALAGEPNAADQKWLQTVEKMVIQGEKKVSTPSEQRVNLLKEWAAKNGYSSEVSKTVNGYRVEVSPKGISKGIAQK